MDHRRSSGYFANPLDDIDRALIRILQTEGRISATDLAARVHLSQPATSARLKRLEETQVIVGYGARVSPAMLGLTIHAVVRLRTTHAQIAEALAQFDTLTEITGIARVTGEDCFILDVYAHDAGRLEEVVDAVGRFGPVSTSVVLREYPAHPLSPAG